MSVGRKSSRWRRLLHRALTATALTIGLALSVAMMWHYVSTVLTLPDVIADGRRLAAEVRELDPGDLDSADVARLRADIDRLDQRMRRLGDFVAGDPLVGVARAQPLVGEQVAAADTVLAAAADLVAAGQIAVGLAERMVEVREQTAGPAGGSLFVGLVDLMGSTRHDVEMLEQHLAAADEKMSALPASASGTFQRAYDSMSEPVRRYRPLLAEYRRIAAVLPEALGWREERRYLVLAQNPAELRPTGGYTGTVGVVTFRPNEPPQQQFVDVYTIDLLPGAPYVEPPVELRAHLLGGQSWKLADANWSPDFPTSAQTALRLYTQQTGIDNIDGVIGLTTFALDRAMRVTGPIAVPDYGVTVRSGEVTLTGLSLTRGISGPNSQRKSFLNALSAALIDRIYGLPQDRWLPMLNVLGEAADEHQVMVWFRDPAVQALVEGSPLANEVRHDDGDYLYVVEANVAPTSKYNLVVDRRTSLRVDIDADGGTTSQLDLVWQSDAGLPGLPYRDLREYSTNHSGLYGSFVRVLRPSGSVLMSAEGQALDAVSGPASVGEETRRSSVGNYLAMAPGPSWLRYAWSGGGAAEREENTWRYRLTIQKQAGMRMEEVSVTVRLPVGATVVSVPDGAKVDGSAVRWTTLHTADVQIELVYRLP